MGWFRRDKTNTADFDHASGHDSLAEVILEQAPNYDEESDIVRPRGRAARLHPDQPSIPKSQRRTIEQRQRSAGPMPGEDNPRPEPSERPVRTIWSNDGV